MLSRLLQAGIFVCVAANLALGQDPTKSESKHYTIAFENDRVQVVNVHYGPHEKSGIHDHPGGVVVILTGGHLKFIDQNGKSQEIFAKAGESRWFPPFKHRVENLGDTTYNAVYIGLKPGSKISDARPESGRPATSAQAEKFVASILASLLR